MIQDFYILSSARKAPKHLVILLHGYGANGKNLLSMAQYWKNILKDILLIVPDAPTPLSPSPNGYEWFDIGDLSPPYLEKGCYEASFFLSEFIEKIQKAYKIPKTQTILSGFSQGGMVALATGLLYEGLCKGIVSYSGGLFLPKTHLRSLSKNVEVCLIHGMADPVVPYSASQKTQDWFLTIDKKITFHSLKNLDHQINEEGLLKGADFIKSILPLSP